MRPRLPFTFTLLTLSSREYDRSLGSPFRAHHTPGQHPQATTTRASQQHGFNHPWPTHPRARPRDPHAARHDNLHEHPGSRPDPFTNPFVQRSTGYRRSTTPGAAPSSHPSNARTNSQPGGFQNAGHSSWTAETRRSSTSDGRPTQDQAAAESGVMRALGASGLVGVIMLVTAIACNSRPG